MSITLSICIPTYCRARFLEQTIESVLAQATEEVELVVSDNASPDDTEEVVRRYQRLFPRLVYFRHAVNVGRDCNYLTAVEAAHGKYCWLLGDDDLLEVGAVERLLTHHLKAASPPDFVLLTGTVYDSTLTQVLAYSANQLGVTKDIYSRNALDFFECFFCESGLSVFVVHREKWMRVDPEKYLSTGLVYLGIVYEYLALDSPVQVVSAPSIKYRSGNASWSSGTLEIIIAHMNHIMDALPERYNPAKPAAMVRYRQRVPVTLRMLVSLRAAGHYHGGLYTKHIAEYFQGRPLTQLAAAVIAMLPSALLRHLKAVLRK